MKTISSKAMTTAWSFFRLGFFQSFRVALKAAWSILKIQAGIATDITYVKNDTGEIRNARALQVGTLSTLVEGFVRYMEEINGRFQWRSFRIANLVIN
jgi:hypothetical protein